MTAGHKNVINSSGVAQINVLASSWEQKENKTRTISYQSLQENQALSLSESLDGTKGFHIASFFVCEDEDLNARKCSQMMWLR